MRHFLSWKLGHHVAASFSVALHASRVESAPAACSLIDGGRSSLASSSRCGSTWLVAEALAAIALATKSNLLLAARAVK